MDKRKGTGITIFIFCIGGFFLYAYLLMLSEWSPIVLQLSILMIAGGILAAIAWIVMLWQQQNHHLQQLLLTINLF